MKLRYVACLVGIFWVFPLAAQSAEPSTQQMIEQLKAPKTRSMRNLTVQSVPVVPLVAAEPVATVVNVPPVSATPVAFTMPSDPSVPSVLPAQGAAQKEFSSLTLMINFDLNASTVSRGSKQALKNLVKAMQSPDLLSAKFEVQGHTDAKGSASYNQKLSQQRAEAVGALLARHGVAPNRLVLTGKGSTELARPEQPFASENRRVRVVNLD